MHGKNFGANSRTDNVNAKSTALNGNKNQGVKITGHYDFFINGTRVRVFFSQSENAPTLENALVNIANRKNC